MFDRPEEILMAVLAALWVVVTYVLASLLGASAKYIWLITGLTGVWSLVAFLLWQGNRTHLLWPILLGLLTACWWPYLDWLVLRDIAPAAADASGVLVLQKPWYASWTFKLILSVLPILAGYAWKFHASRQRKLKGLV